MWVEKDGSLNKTTGVMSFTIKVNSAPTTDRITSIWDQISGGTYRDGYITMTVYESSTTMKQVDSVKIPVSEVKNDAGTRWEINLAKVPLEDGTTKDLSGKYYYVLTYDVDGSSNEVQNQAGLGIGDGGIAGVKKKDPGPQRLDQGYRLYKNPRDSQLYNRTGSLYHHAEKDCHYRICGQRLYVL
jgi:hypothetical protein